MPKKTPPNKEAASAAEIERSIQALNKMAERLWGDGREAEAKALLDALDALNRALDRIRIGESRRVVTLH
jgi:molecular chaperone GrpE (heat shock protein)